MNGEGRPEATWNKCTNGSKMWLNWLCLNPVLKSLRSVICVALYHLQSDLAVSPVSQAPSAIWAPPQRLHERKRTRMMTSSFLSFFQKWFWKCFITIRHQGSRGKYGFITQCIQNTSQVFVKRWPQWYWSVFDLFCCCIKALLCFPEHVFSVLLFFFPF